MTINEPQHTYLPRLPVDLLGLKDPKAQNGPQKNPVAPVLPFPSTDRGLQAGGLKRGFRSGLIIP